MSRAKHLHKNVEFVLMIIVFLIVVLNLEMEGVDSLGVELLKFVQ